MKNNIISIDPGASGGIAYELSNGTIDFLPMPKSDTEIIDLLKCRILSPNCFPVLTTLVFIEDIVKHMGPGIPASTMAVYASNWGFLKGVVMSLGWQLEIVRPQVWQKALGLGITGRQKAAKDANEEEKKRVKLLNGQLKYNWKNKLKAEAQRLYPELSLDITLKTADAVLILEYGKRKTTGGGRGTIHDV